MNVLKFYDNEIEEVINDLESNVGKDDILTNVPVNLIAKTIKLIDELQSELKKVNTYYLKVRKETIDLQRTISNIRACLPLKEDMLNVSDMEIDK